MVHRESREEADRRRDAEDEEREETLGGMEEGLDGGEIHDFLDVAFGQHAETGLAARHDVRVVAEDVQGLRGHGTGAYMEMQGTPPSIVER